MRCYAFVLASMFMYSWLITFEIFQIFFFFDTGVGGWGVSYPNLFWIFIYFLYLQGPLGFNVRVVGSVNRDRNANPVLFSI